MEKHKLTNADEWFIKKGQVDSISRSHFSVGDEVVVCDRQHVMLAEFYDGECPTCHSKKLVPFSKVNVEPGTLHSYSGGCPECGKSVTILFSQHGSFNPYIGKCPVCKRRLSVGANFFSVQEWRQKIAGYITYANYVLGLLLLMLIAVVIVLNYKGVISNQELVIYFQNEILPRTIRLAQELPSFFVSKEINDKLIGTYLVIINKTNIFKSDSAQVFITLMMESELLLGRIADIAIKIYYNMWELAESFRIK